MTLKEIKEIMAEEKSPCVITPRSQQPPSEDEISEWYGVKSEAARQDYDLGTEHDL